MLLYKYFLLRPVPLFFHFIPEKPTHFFQSLHFVSFLPKLPPGLSFIACGANREIYIPVILEKFYIFLENFLKGKNSNTNKI